MKLLTPEDIDAVLADIETQDVRPAIEWIDRLNGPVNRGLGLPWSKTANSFLLRPGELTIWGGESGSGKSLLVGQIMGWIMPKVRVLIASMEMTPAETLRRMVDQAFGSRAPREYCNGWLRWTGEGRDSRLMIYDQTDTVPADKILAMAKHAATHLKCQHIVIDSLTKCGLTNKDRYDQQKHFIDRLQWTAKTTGAHIHLIAHIRKGDDYTAEPQKWDIRGAAEITDLADNALVIWRNRPKEKARELMSLGATVPNKLADSLTEPDTYMRVVKQRHFSFEGTFGLWWDRESGQFTSTQGAVQPYPALISLREPGADETEGAA